jgi:pimeloyl-ACP methyl ester carboxylesterase
MAEVELTQGTVHYREEGSGRAVVLIHGLLVDGAVWDRLVPLLSGSVRCIVPDLPLGAHRTPMRPGADLTPPGLARLIAELLERLDLNEVTLVGNDTGGALCQLVVASHPDRLGRLVLTNCDAFENFPPPAFRLAVQALGRLPGAAATVERLGRIASVRRLVMAPLTLEPLPDHYPKQWIEAMRDRGVRRDVARVSREISSRYTLDAASGFGGFDKPVLIAWGTRDRFFPMAEGERLAAAFPHGRLERIENARTFVQMDAPERLDELILQRAPSAAG